MGNGGTDEIVRIEGAFFDISDTGSGSDWDGSDFDGAQTLVGSDDDDHLIGGSGDDLIIGGWDVDDLTGNGGEDMIFGGWAAIVVEDDMDVTNTALTPDPETELKLSELSFPADIDEHIRVLSGSTGLVSAELVYEKDSETRDVVITPAEMEDDLHILMLG